MLRTSAACFIAYLSPDISRVKRSRTENPPSLWLQLSEPLKMVWPLWELVFNVCKMRKVPPCSECVGGCYFKSSVGKSVFPIVYAVPKLAHKHPFVLLVLIVRAHIPSDWLLILGSRAGTNCAWPFSPALACICPRVLARLKWVQAWCVFLPWSHCIFLFLANKTKC